MKENPMAMNFTALSVALAIGAAVFLLTFPFYSGLDGSLTLIEANGSWVLIPILLPVLVVALPLAFRRRVMRVISSLVLIVFCLISGYTIGLCYFPSVIAMVIAASLGSRIHPREDRNHPPQRPTPKSGAVVSETAY